ncbi:hypothetical protein TPA0910_04330 [Streptomyces hygroscopicus subsp. sporocinereus]|uniref:Uncharacterized protein n=1 Tax=Streptomyces hygroscopicus TaxID=1912 RepID=A0ABQ3TRN5_STRHY|nr:hypothetical protein TPA0910_04330 [Streptomyces hygroscopicus]
MREVGVEFGGFALGEDEVLVAEDDPQPPAQDVQPVVALVRAGVGLAAVGQAGREQVLVRLQPAGFAAQRDDGHAVAGERLRTHPGVGFGRGADQLVDRHPVGPGQGQQEFEARSAPAGLQPGQGADRDAGGLGHGGQGGPAATAQRAQPGSDRGEYGVEVVVHPFTVHSFCGFRKELCRNAAAGGTVAAEGASRCFPDARVAGVDPYEGVVVGAGPAGASGGVRVREPSHAAASSGQAPGGAHGRRGHADGSGRAHPT